MGGPQVLIAGKNRLEAAIVQRLRVAGAPFHVVPGEDPGAILTAVAGSPSALALILAAEDDAGNVDLALRVRRLRPDLLLVIRLFDDQLAAYIRRTIEGAVVLSMSALAAPVFAQHTLRALAATVAPRAPGARRPGTLLSTLRETLDRVRPDRVLLGAIIGLAAVVALTTLYFSRVLALRPLDALYFVWTTVLTVGYGDISLRDAPDAAKLVGMVLMLAGAAFMAVLFAFFTGWVVTRRLEVLEGRVRVRWKDHIIIAGGGNVGVRVSDHLAAAGYKIVVIERARDARHLPALRMSRHHVIVADASNGDVLNLAGIASAAAVVALTTSDDTNLHIALLARAHGGSIPVVMRAESSELSAHVTGRKDAVGLSSLDVAAEAFARAATRPSS